MQPSGIGYFSFIPLFVMPHDKMGNQAVANDVGSALKPTGNNSRRNLPVISGRFTRQAWILGAISVTYSLSRRQ